MQKVWPFSLNFLYFAGIAFTVPFMVLYYQSLGMGGTQIGLVVGLTPLITLFGAPIWTRFADSTHTHKLLIGIAILGGTMAVFLMPFFPTVLPTILLVVVFSIFFAPIIAFTDSATMFMLAGKKELYGFIRVGGTFGFGLAALVAGPLIANYGMKFGLWGGSILFFLGFIVSQRMMYPSKGSSASAPAGGISLLLRNPRWIVFLMLAFAGSLGIAVLNSYLFSYMRELGSDEQSMGYALTVGTASECVFFFVGNRLLKKFKAYPLLVWSLLLAVARSLALAAFNTTEMILLIQFIGGLSFPAMWMAGVSYADENTPPGMSATAQGLFGATVFGFGMSVGGFFGGLLLDNLGGRGLYLVFGLVMLAVVAVAVLIQARIDAASKAFPEDVTPLKEQEG